MYHRVMVPLDGTSFGEHAIPTALRIASRTGAAVDLVHVHVRLPDDGLSAFTPYQYQQVTRHYVTWDDENLRRELAELQEKADSLARESGLSVTARILSGEVVDALHTEADRFHADLIVMATHARTGLARARAGSVADVVVRRATMPVLLLQPTDGAETAAPAPPFRRVLVPLDGSPFSEEVLDPAEAFARVHDAELRLIHVVERRGWLHRGHRQVAGASARPVETVDAVRVRDGILDAARRWDADVIAIATHGRGGVSRMLVGSTASDLLAGTHLPVLLHRPLAKVAAGAHAAAAPFGNA